MTTAFITGVGGQDGSYLAEELLAAGYAVHGLSAPDAPGRPTTGVVTHTADLRDAAAVGALLDAIAPDQIYNLAGVSSVALSWAQPVLTAEVNAVGALGLLEAAHRLADRTGKRVAFVQAASAEVFGEPATSPQDERTPIRPVNPYGISKAFAHQAAAVYRGRGLHACSLILYNHESPRRPPDFVTRKITSTAAAIAQGRATELALGNLDARRDWGWAPDYVHAMRLAAEHPVAGDYVIATGASHSVRDFVAAAFARAGLADWERYVRVDPAFLRPVDATELRGDASKARDVLGWTPSVPFDDLVARMVEADLWAVPDAPIHPTPLDPDGT